MRDFDLVIFDCDGVVVDSEVLACRALAETLVDHGVPVTLDEVFDRFLGQSFAAVEAHYHAVVGAPLPERFRAENRARLAENFHASLQPMPYVREVLAALDRPYGLASSSDAERIRLTLAIAGLESAFGDRVYTASMVARGKPAPDLFLHVAGDMGADPGGTLVIEDTVTGVMAGKAAGMAVWGFVGGSHCTGRDTARRLVDAGADRVFASLADLLP